MSHPPLDPRVLRLTQLVTELEQLSLSLGQSVYVGCTVFAGKASSAMSVYDKLLPSYGVDRLAWKTNGDFGHVGSTRIGMLEVNTYLSTEELEAEVNRA